MYAIETFDGLMVGGAVIAIGACRICETEVTVRDVRTADTSDSRHVRALLACPVCDSTGWLSFHPKQWRELQRDRKRYETAAGREVAAFRKILSEQVDTVADIFEFKETIDDVAHLVKAHGGLR